MSRELFADLNPEQLRAVELVRGPVCILAGAGSGKTTTITRRIANQVVSGAFQPSEVLAVTFTTKAADELKARLGALGASGVPARTFHSAAAAQLRYFGHEERDVLDSKVQLLGPIVRSLPRPFRDRAVQDVAKEIEWAKNARLDPSAYLEKVGSNGRTPPMPPELIAKVYGEYERRKAKERKIDFEDQLELTIQTFLNNPTKLEVFRGRYRAFTVDEYQDVNLLQQTLLELWVGQRDDLCVVGDDYQSIYAFTGATPRYLLGVPERIPHAKVIRLEANYRSTPEILALANRLAPRLGGARKTLRATKPPGPKPTIRSMASNEEEAAVIGRRVKELQKRRVPLREIAVLYRANFRSPLYEEALLAVGVPFQVREGAFLARKAAKTLLPRLRRRPAETSIASAVEREISRAGYVDDPPDDLGAAELTRQKDMGRFLRLARDFDDGRRRVSDFLADLQHRFEAESQRDAVQLMTYHSAKGLEFEAVFMPQAEEGEIPHWRSVQEGTVAEERRLFYVGLTRAKRELHITWSRQRKRSSFLDEMFPEPPRPAAKAPARPKPHRPTRGRDQRIRETRTPSSDRPKLSPNSWLPDWMRERGNKPADNG